MMWQPTIQQFKELFNNDYILNIMVVMNNKSNKSVTPSELSDIIQVHISTAKKYLDLLTKYNFTTKETLTGRLGHPTLYTLITKKIDISLSLDNDIQDSNLDIEIWNPQIREVKNISDIATYNTDDNDLITEIKTKVKTKAKRFVTLSFELTENEQLFMKYLPFSTQDPLSVIKICNKAQINSVIDMKPIENFVKKLIKYNLIEIVYD